MAVRHAREQGARVLAICNTNGSTIPRESDAVLYTQAGPEIAVASTKAFLTQIVAVYLVALYLAQVRGNKFGDEVAAIVEPAGDDAAEGRPRPGHGRGGARAGPAVRRRAARCCSSAGTWATPWPSRAR